MGIYFHIFLSIMVFITTYFILVPKNTLPSRISEFIHNNIRTNKGIYTHHVNIYINSTKNKNSILSNYILTKKNLLISAGFYNESAFTILNYIKLAILIFIILIITISYGFHLSVNLVIIPAIVIELASTRYISYIRTKRIKQIKLELPNLLDLFIILANAGYTINLLFKISAIELSLSNPVIASELAKTALEFELSPDVEGIILRFSDRIQLKEIQNLTSILIHAYKFGSGLKESIAAFSEDLRNKRLLSIEDKAGKIPNILIMPMIFFILPCLLIVILAPIILKLMTRIF